LVAGDAVPRLALDLPGSVEALALDASGKRLVVARREQHANRFSTRGAMLEAESGERDLAPRAPARAGGELALARRVSDPGQRAGSALGARGASPLELRCGALWLVRPPRWVLFGGAPGGAGRIDARCALPPGTTGLAACAQAALFTVAGPRLTASCV